MSGKYINRLPRGMPADQARALSDVFQDLSRDATQFQLAADGAVARSTADKLGEVVSVKDFGAVGDGVATDVFQTAVNNGGVITVPDGEYRLAQTTTIDYGSTSFPSFTQSSDRVSIIGASRHSTFLRYSGAAGTYCLSLNGPSSFSYNGVYAIDTLANLSLVDQSPLSTRGILLRNRAYFEIDNVHCSYFATGMTIDACLSSTLRNMYIYGCTDGLVLDNTTGQSLPNVLLVEASSFQNNSSYGVVANKLGASNKFVSCRFEGNGTHGVSGHGGFVANISGDNGTAIVFLDSCYFENNAGDADVRIVNTTNANLSVVLLNCTFNRTSSSRYTTNNVRLLNSAGGSIRASLIGCSFLSTGTYAPSSSRPFISYDQRTALASIGCSYSETTSLGTSGANFPYAAICIGGSVNANGTSSVTPNGITSTKTATGIYTIARGSPGGPGFGETTNGYIALATSTDLTGGLVVQRVAQLDNRSFQVVTTNTSGVLTDCAFNWIVLATTGN